MRKKDGWSHRGFNFEDQEHDPAEREPSLGSVAANENESQGEWAAGARNDTEEQHDAEG